MSRPEKATEKAMEKARAPGPETEAGKRPEESRGANPLRLRAEIDAGRTGDKLGFPDPAAAPLGTDDEAAGTPVSREQLRLARRAELAQGARARRNPGPRPLPQRLAVLAILLLIIITAILIRANSQN
ncbi:hypothetical protein LOS78_20590 (plasmid) [Paracoccus sp. MA]|uniref:hypothetical protein n=1 Tax=Paracoccus sp. MA TaxID=2895796 RepID=UPI001E59E6BF|nr:hypothetical protein [Paracoccus sp. MA]UFM64466.1 hypothetical protein LOS78_03040 [Paracoccus sp. MA]UFM66923.1 hypothetical protein LOS78_20590 [Paracoccus sp. MA]